MADVPRFERKTAFRVTNVVGFSIASPSVTTLDFDTVVYDLGSNFNLTTNTYVAPLDGIYHLNAHYGAFHAAAGDGRAIIMLWVNGAENSRGTDNQLRGTLINDRYSWDVNTELHLNQGDAVTAVLQISSGPALTALAGSMHQYFAGHRIQSESRTILGG